MATPSGCAPAAAQAKPRIVVDILEKGHVSYDPAPGWSADSPLPPTPRLIHDFLV